MCHHSALAGGRWVQHLDPFPLLHLQNLGSCKWLKLSLPLGKGGVWREALAWPPTWEDLRLEVPPGSSQNRNAPPELRLPQPLSQ